MLVLGILGSFDVKRFLMVKNERKFPLPAISGDGRFTFPNSRMDVSIPIPSHILGLLVAEEFIANIFAKKLSPMHLHNCAN